MDANRYKTHCKNGHQLSGENLYVAAKTGWRSCRQCRCNATKEFHLRNPGYEIRRRALKKEMARRREEAAKKGAEKPCE